MPGSTPIAVAARPASTLWEAAIVLGLPLALFFAQPIWRLLAGADVGMRPDFTDARLLTVLGAEVALATVLLLWLNRRGWHLRTQVGPPQLGDVPRGMALWVATWAAGGLVVLCLAALAPDFVAATRAAPLRGDLSLWVVVAALAINPVFEEVLWLGYAIAALEQVVGLRAAAIISITLRVLVHFNQGVLALVSVLPVAIVFTVYFVYTRRLWPVVVAHVIVNAFGLGEFVRGSP